MGNGNNSEMGAPGPSGKQKHVLLKERWVRPCPQYQKGAIFTWAGKELLRASNLLDYYPDLPFFMATMVPDDNDIFATSILWDLIPLQNFVNAGMSAARRWLKMIALLRLWVPTDSGLKEVDLDNATSMAVGYDGPTPPKWDVIPELSQSIFKLIEQSRELMSSYGYANELAKRGQTSGNALGILQEMDDTIFKPGLLSLQSMYARASKFTCDLAPMYIDTPRMVRATSMQGWQIDEFKGDMITGDFHVEVNMMTGLPTNKAMRLEFLKGLFKDGILSQEEVKSHLEFGTDNEALEAAQKQNEIADKRVEDLLNFPGNYNQVPDKQTGQLTWECKTTYNAYDNHPLMLMKLQTALQESGEHWEVSLPYVKIAFLEPGADSIQAPSNQPPEGQVPPPLNQGF